MSWRLLARKTSFLVKLIAKSSMLSTDALQQIDKEIAKYPANHQASAVMAALRIAQEEKGHLTTELMDFVAQYLSMPPIAVYEVGSFYNMYDLAPVGKYKIAVCTNLPCALGGANKILRHLQERLGIEINETTADGKFTLKEAECMGACGDAPLFLINNKQMNGFLTADKVDQILAELR